MSMLTGPEILREVRQGRIEIDPFVEENIQPSSVDLRLGTTVKVYSSSVQWYEQEGSVSRHISGTMVPKVIPNGPELNRAYLSLDMKEPPPDTGRLTDEFTIDESGWVLKPGILYLMHTEERLHTKLYATDITGKSSTARIGVQVHLTAGFGDPGFDGQYTLEVNAVHPAILYPGDLVCQARFWTLQGQVQSYQERGRYVGERAVGPHAAAEKSSR
jgi:deoxycytidine triphosphate deaminase